jgi:tetratricopeptide (TPR) repeat protein
MLFGNPTAMSNWFDAREATEFGTALADQFTRSVHSSSAALPNKKGVRNQPIDVLQQILDRADSNNLKLNFYKKAKFANSFKWRLLENGLKKEVADEVTERVLVHLARNKAASALVGESAAGDADRTRSVRQLLTDGNKCMFEGAYSDAISIYQKLLQRNPRDPDALNNLGAALVKIGLYAEAEEHFREATRLHPDFASAHSNLGEVLRIQGQFQDAENWLRRAVKLNPKHTDARNNLGLTFVFLGRLGDATNQFKKSLKLAPQNAGALFGMGHVAAIEGRFDEAKAMFNRALHANPRMASAWASMAGLRKMTPSDGAWLERAQQIAASGISPLEEADLRFAIGKYYDDVEDFTQAFKSYKDANELQKTAAAAYQPLARTQFVDDLMRVYTRESMSNVSPASDSMKPIFVVGMPRSGTSLVEQIIASHPSVKGAGELGFWSRALQEHGAAVRQGLLDLSTKKKLADAYLRALEARCGDSPRIVDKTPLNFDNLGIIHSVFPKARIIYMQRDPVDTCLSCYFQKFSAEMDFASELINLAHFYKQHQRVMAHWRALLPPGTILDVPYAELVAHQELWTRKILEFLGLEWNEQCLDFNATSRLVATASFWQVKQPIFEGSVGRWRNYEKFIGPLLALRD